MISILTVGASVVLTIVLYGREPYTLVTVTVGFLLIVAMILVFRSYLGNQKLAKQTFAVIPCRKGVIRLVGRHIVICIRCFVIYAVTLALTPITFLSSQMGRHIWIEFYLYVESRYGSVTYFILTLILLSLLPIHGTYTVLSRKESNLLRGVTSALFSISLFLIYAYLAVRVFGIPNP